MASRSISANSGIIGTFANATLAGLPLVGIVALLLYALPGICRRGSSSAIMSMDGTELSGPRHAGVRTGRIHFGLFLVSGIMSAAAGVVLAATLTSGNPMIGGSFFMDGLTAVFLGATVIRLGQPNIIGTGLGVITLGVLTNGLALSAHRTTRERS